MVSLDVIAELDYDTFLEKYLKLNEPVLFQNDISSWPIVSNWLKNGQVDYEYLQQNYGELENEILDCSTGESKSMKLRDFFGLLEQGLGQTCYLKDFHLHLRIPEVKEVSLPLSQDDWMDDDELDDDYKFLYFGGSETATLLHADVFSSYSISSQVFGKKLWTLFPPSCTQDLLRLIKLAQREGKEVDIRDWKEKDKWTERGSIKVIQRQGETIFIPSGWYHQVQNLDHPTISINKNWANSTNVVRMYESLAAEVTLVRASIDDVRDLLQNRSEHRLRWEAEWEKVVGEVLKLNAGWNWLSFWRMVLRAIEPKSMIESKLRPTTAYIHSQVRPICDKFLLRGEAEWKWAEGVKEVLDSIQLILDAGVE